MGQAKGALVIFCLTKFSVFFFFFPGDESQGEGVKRFQNTLSLFYRSPTLLPPPPISLSRAARALSFSIFSKQKKQTTRNETGQHQPLLGHHHPLLRAPRPDHPAQGGRSADPGGPLRRRRLQPDRRDPAGPGRRCVLPRLPAGLVHDPGARQPRDALDRQLCQARDRDRRVGRGVPEPDGPAIAGRDGHRARRRLPVLAGQEVAEQEGRGGEGGLKSGFGWDFFL